MRYKLAPPLSRPLLLTSLHNRRPDDQKVDEKLFKHRIFIRIIMISPLLLGEKKIPSIRFMPDIFDRYEMVSYSRYKEGGERGPPTTTVFFSFPAPLCSPSSPWTISVSLMKHDDAAVTRKKKKKKDPDKYRGPLFLKLTAWPVLNSVKQYQ